MISARLGWHPPLFSFAPFISPSPTVAGRVFRSAERLYRAQCLVYTLLCKSRHARSVALHLTVVLRQHRRSYGPSEFSLGSKTRISSNFMTRQPPTPKSITPSNARRPKVELPSHLTRLLKVHNAVQQALSHALATCAISPSTDSGRVLNVLNHISLKTYSGFATSFGVEDLKRLCWVWEWDGKALPENNADNQKKDDDNPFLENSSTSDWMRGSMGFTLSLGSHYCKSERKRIPVYGIGIEVEMDIDKDMGGGMAARSSNVAGRTPSGAWKTLYTISGRCSSPG